MTAKNPIDPISLVIDALLSVVPNLAGKALEQEKIVHVLNLARLRPGSPPSTFEGCYVFALVDFNHDGLKSKSVMEFFRNKDTRDVF